MPNRNRAHKHECDKCGGRGFWLSTDPVPVTDEMIAYRRAIVATLHYDDLNGSEYLQPFHRIVFETVLDDWSKAFPDENDDLPADAEKAAQARVAPPPPPKGKRSYEDAMEGVDDSDDWLDEVCVA